ncbi:MAG: hypothetical protein PHV32_09375 [Eubacteriales bacterium]|nr:hypothetical protein [Eubacteriales bacterium]
MELLPVIELLRQKRSLFHSEADFQFALAWEMQITYTTAEIRLEYPPANYPNKYIDIQYYWNAPSNPNAGYAAFSVHHGAKKTGTMSWGSHLSAGTIKGREKELHLKNEYNIIWNDYSDLDVKSGLFKYALMRVEA